MDTVVQLVRNGLCCIKDWNLFAETGIHEAAQLPLPAPLNKTTLLEVLIGLTQAYAFFSVSMSGFNLILNNGFRKLRTVQNLQEKHQRKRGDTPADDLVRQRLAKEKTAAQKNIFIGFNVMSIGLAFFWLVGNSFHVTETDWIGGVQALIHALTVMEICLVPLLYYMIADAIQLIGRAAVMEYLAKILRKCTDKVPHVILTDETFAFLLQKEWTPFWNGKSGLDDAEQEKGISEELANLVSELESWTQDKDNKAMKATIQKTAARLETDAVTTRYEAYREFLYFILNFVAFYGYMLAVLVFYRDNEDDQHVSVRTLKFGLNNADADWTGNFAGDLMWTIGEINPVLDATHLLLLLTFYFAAFRTFGHLWKSCTVELVEAKTHKAQDRLETVSCQKIVFNVLYNMIAVYLPRGRRCSDGQRKWASAFPGS